MKTAHRQKLGGLRPAAGLHAPRRYIRPHNSIGNRETSISWQGVEGQVELRGKGKHMGSKVTWRKRLRMSDGAFHESVTSSDRLLSYEWGYEGVGGRSWEVDSSGVLRQLALDDHEAIVLSAWARSGIYALPQLSKLMEIEEVHPGQVNCRLKGGKLITSITQDPLSRQTKVVTQRLMGSSEEWTLLAHRTVRLTTLKGLSVATEIEHKGSSTSTYRLEQVEHCEESEGTHGAFELPSSPLLPTDTEFDIQCSEEVPIWLPGHTMHLLVKPKVKLFQGLMDDGYWLLDTGASGFVVSASKLRDLGKLNQFGELTASGVSGKATATLIQAESFSLGPLTIHKPIMMIMDLNGLVKGKTIDGIIGYDFFRRVVLEVHPPPSQIGGRSKSAARSLALSHPSSYLMIKSPEAIEDPITTGSRWMRWIWTDLVFISCLPHVYATLKDASGCEHKLLFLLDTGASGAGLFIHSRAVESHQIDLRFLAKEADGFVSHQMKGVGGQGSVSVDIVEIPSVSIGGLMVAQVRCVVTKDAGGTAGIDLSIYSSGIIGIDLFQGLTYCLNSSQNKLGFLL